MLDKFQANDDRSKVFIRVLNIMQVLARRTALTALPSSPCAPCLRLPLPSQLIHDAYYDRFNFYFAKPINEILANCQTPHTILFKDLLYLDHPQEYLKRFYFKDETTHRLQLLASFLAPRPAAPNLVVHRQSQNIDKRLRKLHKLHALKPELKDQPQPNPPPLQVLASLDNPKPTSDTFETLQHDIYSQFISHTGDSQPQHPKKLSFHNPILQPHQKLYEITDHAQLNEVFNQINVITQTKISSLVKLELESNDFDSYPIHKFLKKPQNKEMPTLNLEKVNKKTNIVHLMQQFQKIPNKHIKSKFYEQVKGFYTERVNRDKKEEHSISPSFVNVNSVALKDNYKFGKKSSEKQVVKSSVWRTQEKSQQQQQQQKRKQKQEQQEELSSTCEQRQMERERGEQEKLLKLLRQENTSQPVSPHRKLEIKLNLNKLILEQQSILKRGCWTGRKQEEEEKGKKGAKKQRKSVRM